MEPVQRQCRSRRLRRRSRRGHRGFDGLDAIRGHGAAVWDDVYGWRSGLRRERQPLRCLERPAHDCELSRHSGPDALLPVSPRQVSNESAISLKWQPSTDANGVAGYSVYRDGNYSGSTSGTSYTVAGLSCGTSYVIAVEAYDAAGNRSARSSAPMATSACPPPAAPAPPADTTPPTTPTGLAATGATSSSISLRWDASSDASGVRGYGLYRDGNAAGSVALTNATFSGLSCGRSYTLSVDAYDASGNRSSRSSVVSSTAPCPDTTPPSPPTS